MVGADPRLTSSCVYFFRFQILELLSENCGFATDVAYDDNIKKGCNMECTGTSLVTLADENALLLVSMTLTWIYIFVCMDPKSSDAEVVATDTGADKLLSTKTEEEIMRDIFESIENAQRIAIASINALENSVKEVDEDMKRLRAFCDL
ncbi:hypothetical protein P3L10_015387 [Capsicum annuum]